MKNSKEILGNFITTKKGFAFKSKWYARGGHPIVKVSDMSENSINTDGLTYIPNKIACDYKSFALKAHDIVIQTVGSWPTNPKSVVGKVVKIPKSIEGALLNQNAVIIYPNEKLDKMYLYYILKNYNFKNYIIGTAQGAANQASITLESIKKFKFELIPISTQRKISNLLFNLDSLIENNLRSIKILESVVRNLYQKWFVNFCFPRNENITLIKSELGKKPRDWKITTLENIIKVNKGKSYKSEEISLNNGMPFINLKCIYKGGGFRRDGLKKYKGKYKDTHTVFSNDTVIAVTDMSQKREVVGRVARIGDAIKQKYIISLDIVSITPLEQLGKNYLYSLLRFSNFSNIIKKYANGTNVLHLNPKNIENFKILHPPISLIQSYENIVRPIFHNIDFLDYKNKKLKAIIDLVSPKLISGEINASNLNIIKNNKVA